MKSESKIAMGGAKASKKLMAAMAVLAVAFVVLAAVPITASDAGTDEQTGQAIDKVITGASTGEGLTTKKGGWYFVENTASKITLTGAGPANIVMSEDSTAEIALASGVVYNIYIGTDLDDDDEDAITCTYYKNTLIVATGDGSKTISAVDADDRSIVFQDASILTYGVAVSAGASPTSRGASTVKVHSILQTGVSYDLMADTSNKVEVKMDALEKGETAVTTDFDVQVRTNAAEAETSFSARVSVDLTQNSEEVDFTITYSATTILTIGDKAIDAGSITVLKGKLGATATAPTAASGVLGICEGKASVQTYYPTNADYTQGTYNASTATNISIAQGTENTKGSALTITYGSGATMILSEDFKATGGMIDITFSADKAGTLTTSQGTGYKDAAAWDGTITVCQKTIELGAGNYGNIQADANATALSSTGAINLYGTLKMVSNLSLGAALDVMGGAEISYPSTSLGKLIIGSAAVTFKAPSNLTIDLYGADAVANKIALSNVSYTLGETGYAGLSVSTTAISGYNSGTIECGTGITTMGIDGAIGTLKGTGLVIGFTGTADVYGDMSVAQINGNSTTGTNVLNLNGAVGISTTCGVAANTETNTIVIASGSVVTLGSGVNWTIGNGTTLNVLGKITGGTITLENAGKVTTNEGQESKVESDITSPGAVTAAAGTATDLTSLKKQVSLGFVVVEVSGTLSVDDAYEVPAGITVDVTGVLTVQAKKTLTINGTLKVGGLTLVEKTTASSGADRAIVINNGDLEIGTEGLTVPDNTTYINYGTMTFNGASNSTVKGYFENAGTMIMGYAADASAAVTAAIVITVGDAAAELETEFQNTGKIWMNSSGAKIEVLQYSTFANTGVVDYSTARIGTGSIPEITGAGTFDNQGNGLAGVQVNTTYVTGVTKTLEISDDMDQKHTYMSLQTLKIASDKNLKLTETSKVIVNGQFIIDGTLTIEGILQITGVDGTAKAASLLVNGKIVIAEGGQLILGNDTGSGNLTVSSGASLVIQDGGELELKTGGYYTVSGSLTADEGSVLTANKLTVYGTADLNGYMSGSVYDAGVVTIDNGQNENRGAAKDLEVSMYADGAVLNVVSFLMEGSSYSWSKLTVTDKNLYTYVDYNDYTKNKKVSDDNYDEIVIEFDNESDSYDPKAVVVDGELVIKQSASYKTVKVGSGTDKSQTYGMDVSGALSADIKYEVAPQTVNDRMVVTIQTAGTEEFAADKKVTSTSGGISVTGELSIDDYILATITAQSGVSAKLKVSGSIDAQFATTDVVTIGSNATVDVTGQIVASSEMKVEGKVNAVYYKTVVGTGKDKVTTHYYTTLDKAIEGVQVEGNTSEKVVKIIGAVTLKEDVTLPETVKLQFYDSNASLNVGTSSARATLTAENEITTSKSGQIVVDGTLMFVKAAFDKTTKTVSDVTYTSGDAKIYTNVYSAVEEAGKSSDAMTITVTREPGTGLDQKVKLTDNLVIPSNVTLVVGDAAHTAGLKLMDGVTMTVDGTLKTGQAIDVETQFAINALDIEATASSDAVKSSTVVVNGQMYIGEAAYDGTNSYDIDPMVYGIISMVGDMHVYGAAYMINGWYVVSNIDDALTETEIVSEGMYVFGPVVGSDAAVTANDTFSGVVVADSVFRPVGAQSSNTVETSLTMNSLTLGEGTVLEIYGSFTGTVEVGENAADLKAIAPATDSIYGFANADGSMILYGDMYIASKDQSASVSAGTVYLGGEVDDIDEGFALTGSALKIASGATAIVGYSNVSVAKLNVAGTLEVPSNMILSVTGQMDVSGTVKVSEASASAAAGSIQFGTGAVAYVGMAKSDYYSSGAAAVLSGPFTLSTGASIYVASDATIDQDMSDYKSTAFYNGGSLWFTAYANGSEVPITLNKAPLTNAVLAGWSKTDGGDKITDTSGNAVYTFKIGANSKLYSVVEKQIYKIVIRADQGIGDLYLNGNIMSKGTIVDGYGTSSMESYYAYWATVEAGTYEVTCKLANGFSGTPGLKDSTGATVSANKISVSGTPAFGVSQITVEYQLTGVTASGYVEPTEKKDDGLTVTDYLLIVLVILVVILAVIVALRLMRS